MTNITMCKDSTCETFQNCYRAQAKPEPVQIFYPASPREAGHCYLYAPMTYTDGSSALKEPL